MVMTAATLVRHRGLAPPASEESEAMPVTVRVRTVVVRSGTASFLTTALRTPIARARRTINPYVRPGEISALVPALAAKLVVPGFLIVPAGNSRDRFVGHRPGTELHWQINRHLWTQADYGIFYAGKFLKEESPGRNLNYWALWAGYKF
jgi:hypothetical protein